MTFLAALTLAGALAAAGMAEHWRQGAAAVLTVQVPRPQGPSAEGTRLDRAVALLRGTPGIIRVRVLGDDELAGLLRPWLGTGPQAMAMALPAVIEVRLADGEAEPPDTLAARLQGVAPGAFLESHALWLQRLTILARSVEACGLLALLTVAGVAGAVVAVATRAGLAARRDAIEIVHGLGASDGYIAGRFARRAGVLAAIGGCAGAAVALPVLLALAQLAAPFATIAATPGLLPHLPGALWLALPGLPAVAAAIGWGTAQATVHRWLRRLP